MLRNECCDEKLLAGLKRIGDESALPALESVALSKAEYKSVREMAQNAVELMKKREIRNE